MMTVNVDEYFTDGCGRCKFGGTPQCKVHTWEEVLRHLRMILQTSGLAEECKWGMPCYTFKKKNVLMLSAFKNYCSVSFFKGALLSDPHRALEKQGENAQAARLLKFTNIKQVFELEMILRKYIAEAIEIEKAGKKIAFEKEASLDYPDELQQMMTENALLKTAFEALTPGRKRGYIIYFNQAKHAKTRYARIEKCIPKIMDGKGWNDR